MIPRHFKVDHEHTVPLSDDELRARLVEVLDVDPALLAPPVEGNVGRE